MISAYEKMLSPPKRKPQREWNKGERQKEEEKRMKREWKQKKRKITRAPGFVTPPEYLEEVSPWGESLNGFRLITVWILQIKCWLHREILLRFAVTVSSKIPNRNTFKLLFQLNLYDYLWKIHFTFRYGAINTCFVFNLNFLKYITYVTRKVFMYIYRVFSYQTNKLWGVIEPMKINIIK